MNNVNKKQTLSSSSLPTLTSKDGILAYQRSKIPIPNGIPIISSSIPINTNLSSISTLRSSSTTTISSNSCSSNSQSRSQATILSSGSVSSTGKCLLSSTSLRGDNSLFSNNRLTGSQASLFGSTNGNGASDYKAKSQVCITTNNGRSNDISHESDSNLSTSTLTSTSHGLKLTTSDGSGNTTVTFGNGGNHNNASVWSSSGGTDGESVKLSSSSGTSPLPEESTSIGLSSASVSSNNSSYHNGTSNCQGMSTSEFSDVEADTTTSSSDLQHQCPDVSRIPSDADNSIDMFAQTPAAKKIQVMMEGHPNQSLDLDDKAESDEDMIGDIIVPATQAVLSSHGSSPLDFSPDAIVIVMASDEEDDSFACSSPLNPVETAMVFPSTEENSEFSFSSKNSPVHLNQNQSLCEGNDIIVPATQQFQLNISDNELQEPYTIACSDEDEDSISSKNIESSQLRSYGTVEPKILNMNSTFTVSPFPMKISSRGDGTGIIRNQPEKCQFSSNSNIPKIQLDAIVEVNFDGNSLDHLELNASAGAGNCSNLQPMNSTFVMNFPDSQKSSEQLNVTFTAAPSKNNSHEEGNICSHKGDDDNVKCSNIDTENYNSRNVKNVASSSSLDTAATSTVSECLTPVSTVPSCVNSSMVVISASPSPRRGKKLYDVPQPPPLKTMEPPPKNVDSSDSEEESVSAHIVGSSTAAAAATSRSSKPRTYSRRGRDTKADREALFETENPRPSTSAALVRHNMRSLKMKPRSSSRMDKSDGRLSAVPGKSNRAPARTRSKNDNSPLKINSKPKPKLRIPKKVKKVLSSSDDDVEEKNTPLQDLPDIDIPLLKSKSSKQRKPQLAEKTENETEEVPLIHKLEVRDESVQPGIESEELLRNAVDSRTEENVRLNLCVEDGCVGTAKARSPSSGSTSSKDNLQAKPIPLDSAIKSSPPVLQAARKQPELQEFNPAQEDGPESGSVEDQPPILLREKNPPQRQTRKRGRPTRADQLKTTTSTDNFFPVAAPPVNYTKSECPPGENKDQCKPKSCEEIERTEVICVSPSPTFSPAQRPRHLANSVVESQPEPVDTPRVRTFLSSESEAEAESKVSKHSDNMGSAQSTKNVGEIGKPCSSYSDLPPTSKKNEKHSKSKENSAATNNRQNIVKSSTVRNGKNPAMPKKQVARRPSPCTTGSTPSNISEAETNPSKPQKKEHIQKKAGKRSGKTEYHTEVEDLPSQTRSKRVRRQFEVNDEMSVIIISDEDDHHVEVDDKKSKRGRPKKRKAGENHLVEVETLDLGVTKKSLNVVAVQSLNPKKPKNDENPSLGSNRNTASKVKITQQPEVADVPQSEGRGLRRSGRPRKERDFGDGMMPY